MNAIIKYLLQSGQPPGTSKTYIYTLEKATTKADLKPDTCWDLKALQAAAQVSCPSPRRPAGRSPSPCRGREQERIFPRG